MARFSTQREHCNFILGLTDPAQLKTWLAGNPTAIGLAMVGRSNVGKSSLINTIFGSKTAKTSKTPGRTRQINVFEFNLEDIEEDRPNKFYLFDLPGYGHASVSKEMSSNWEELMGTFFEMLGPHILLMNMQDARHPNQQSDQEFHRYIKGVGITTFLVFNKMDKLKKQKEKAALKNLKPKLFQAYKWVRGIFFISAESRDGVDQLKEAVINHLINEQNKLLHRD